MTFLTTKISTRLLLLFTLVVSPAQAYYCYHDNFGNYQCNGSGLSYALRIVISLSLLALCLALVAFFFMRRRRTMRARNMAYLQNQQESGQPPPPPPGQWANPVPGGPAPYPPYPPAADYRQYPPGYPGGFGMAPQEPPKAYDPSHPVSPPPPQSGSPPGYFPPPQGPPPAVNYETHPNQAPEPYKV